LTILPGTDGAATSYTHLPSMHHYKTNDMELWVRNYSHQPEVSYTRQRHITWITNEKIKDWGQER